MLCRPYIAVIHIVIIRSQTKLRSRRRIEHNFQTYKKGDIEAIEKVQKRATKLVISLKKLPYKERSLQLNLHTLKYRRLRRDMIEVYKITHDMYDRSVALELPRNVSSTRGNKYKLQNHSFHYNFRKNFLLHE